MVVFSTSESPEELPRVPSVEVKEIHVLVHPHFFRLNRSPENGGHQRFQKLEPHLRNVKAVGNLELEEAIDPRIINALGRSQLAFAFYKRKVDRLRADPSTLLIILTGENKELEDDAQSLGMDVDAYCSSLTALGDRLPFQQRLIDYSRQLGGRVELLLDIDLNESGALLQQLIGRMTNRECSDTPVKVYGEALGQCPNVVVECLRECGFTDVELLAERCPQ